MQTESLCINGIKFGDEEFNAIASCMKNVERLTIVHSESQETDDDFTMAGICALVREILKRDKPVSLLMFSFLIASSGKRHPSPS